MLTPEVYVPRIKLVSKEQLWSFGTEKSRFCDLIVAALKLKAV